MPGVRRGAANGGVLVVRGRGRLCPLAIGRPNNLNVAPSFLDIYISWCRCFCGSTPEPRPSPLATPHSCANLCSRTRPCGHPCPLSCHPGPCPSCQVRVEMRCYCDRRPLSFKCSNLSGKDASGSADLSCGGLCGKNLGCGSHTCGQICHPGDCELCGVSEITKCYCGKVDREVRCGEGEEKECSLAGKDGQLEQKWVGKFSCDGICNRLGVVDSFLSRDLLISFYSTDPSIAAFTSAQNLVIPLHPHPHRAHARPPS